MSDLISRSKLLKEIETWGGCVEALHEYIENMPTAYDIDKVVEELEQKKEEVQRMRNTCVALSDLEVCDIENVTYKRAIEIVKHGGVSNDVCEWKTTQINNEWKPSCEPNSTYNVFGVAWFKRCPYCGNFDDKVIEVNYEENDDNDELFVYDKNIIDLDLDSDKLNKDIKKYIEELLK